MKKLELKKPKQNLKNKKMEEVDNLPIELKNPIKDKTLNKEVYNVAVGLLHILLKREDISFTISYNKSAFHGDMLESPVYVLSDEKTIEYKVKTFATIAVKLAKELHTQSME